MPKLVSIEHSDSKKRCSRCREVKDHREFSKRRASWDGLQSYCRPCNSMAVNETASAARNIAIYLALKNQPCSACGGSFPPECIEFDHVDPSEKRRNISALLRGRPEVFDEEMTRCVPVCANCHRIKTARNKEYRPRLYNQGVDYLAHALSRQHGLPERTQPFQG